jgi:hypothetical protein
VITDLDALENDPRVQAVLADPRVQAVLANSGHDPKWWMTRVQAELMLCPATTANLVPNCLTGASRAVSAERLMGAVRETLNGQGDNDTAAREDGAEAALYTRLKTHAPKALAAAQLPSPDEAEAEARRVLDDPAAVFGPDQRFEDYLRKYGKEAEEIADIWGVRATERAARARGPSLTALPFPGHADPLAGARERPGILWAGWWSGPAGIPIDPNAEVSYTHPWLVFLAWVLWEKEVRCDITYRSDRARRKKAPALPMRLAEGIADIEGSSVAYSQVVRKKDGKRSPLAFSSHALQNTQDAALVVPRELVASVERTIGTVTMWRTVDWLIKEAHQAYLDGGNLKEIEIVGGWSELAKRVGSTSRETPTRLRELFDVFVVTTIQWDSPDGSGHSNLANYSITPHGPGHPAVLRITPGTVWKPGVVSSLPRGNPGRALVPWLGAPPLEGLARPLHAKARRLDTLMAIELSDRVGEYRKHRGVSLDWGVLARRVELDEQHIPKLQNLWKQRYHEISPGRWWLAETEETKGARALLEERAQLVEGGQKRGKAAAARKRGRLAGRGK